MARTSRIQGRALSRRTVVIRSLACAAGAAASLAPVDEASAKMASAGCSPAVTHSGGLPTSKSNFGTTTALFNAAGEFQCPSIGSIGEKHDARGKHFCTVP